MQASPTFAKTSQIGSSSPSKVFTAYKWKKQQGEVDQHPSFTPLKEVTAAPDGYQKRRVKIQDLIRRTMLLCRADAPLGRVPRGIMARELGKAIPSEKGKGKGAKGASQSSQMEISS